MNLFPVNRKLLYHFVRHRIRVNSVAIDKYTLQLPVFRLHGVNYRFIRRIAVALEAVHLGDFKFIYVKAGLGIAANQFIKSYIKIGGVASFLQAVRSHAYCIVCFHFELLVKVKYSEFFDISAA